MTTPERDARADSLDVGRNFGRRTVLAAVGAAGVGLTMARPSSATTDGLAVDPTDVRQRITMMGGDMERNPAFLLEAENPREIAQWLFADTGFGVCRVQYDKNQELVDGHSGMDFYAGQVQAMRLVRDANPAVEFYAVLRSDYMVYGKDLDHPETINNWPAYIYVPLLDERGRRIGDATPFDAERYGVFLADYVEFMHAHEVPISYLNTGKESTGIVTPEVSARTIMTLRAELALRGVPVPRIAAPGAWGVSGSTSFVTESVRSGWGDLYDVYATHNLRPDGPAEWSAFTSAAHAVGRDAWDEESNSASGGRTSGTEPDLSSALTRYGQKMESYRNGLNGEVFFEVFSRGVDSESRTVYFRSREAGRRMRSYYIMKDWTQSLVGSRVTPVTTQAAPLDSLAFVRPGTTSVWVLNPTDDARRVPLTVAGSLGAAQQRTWTAEEDATGTHTSVPNRQHCFDATFPAQSITRIRVAVPPSARNT